MTVNSSFPSPHEAVREIARRTWQSLLAIGVVSVILGVVIVVWPAITVLVAAIVFGAYLLVSGVVQLSTTFAVQHAHGWWRFLSFVSGAVSILLAFVAFRNIAGAVVLLALWIGIGWVIRGVTEVSVFLDAQSGLPGRGAGIAMGVVTVIAGAVLIIWPISSIATLAWVSGIMLVAIGIAEVANAISLRNKIGRTQTS